MGEIILIDAVGVRLESVPETPSVTGVTWVSPNSVYGDGSRGMEQRSMILNEPFVIASTVIGITCIGAVVGFISIALMNLVQHR
jgi:hypothetical protein